MALRDTDVEGKGESLRGKRILLGVTGGIASVDTVRLCREFRRYGAELTVIMTPSAQKIITPLAVKWAAQCDVITDFDSDLEALNHMDAIVVAPATRHILASTVHGLQHGPLLMALSVARNRQTPTIFVPSMHEDLAEEPITRNLCDRLTSDGAHILWGSLDEGKQKTPSHEAIVAHTSHLVHSASTSASVVITLGATKSHIDDIRYVANTSTGSTGWGIADMLYRYGHDVSCVVGLTSQPQPQWLPLCIHASTPEKMLNECIALSNDSIDVWIHTAAVLDYVVKEPVEGKIASQQGVLEFQLQESLKHIHELRDRCKNALRIGFKLESGIKQKDLVYRAHAQIQHSGMNAVIANRLEDLNQGEKPRAYLVDEQGVDFALQTVDEMHEAIRTLIDNRR
jgi:phosphopantothenoylcysteine decarboxylase/phosphopantothenate--cysteine ligase